MRRDIVVSLTAAAAFAGALFAPLHAQLPFTTQKSSGQSVTPAYEGWYRNADGTFTLSFGYFNRNTTEVVEVPIGPQNFVTPGAQNQGQPAHVLSGPPLGRVRREGPGEFRPAERGRVDADLSGADVRHSRHAASELADRCARGGSRSGNTPPVLRFGETAPEGSGPFGATGAPVTGRAGQPVPLSVFVKDDGRGATSVAGGGRGAPAITLAWFKHQGPGAVKFEPATGRGVHTGSQISTLGDV